MTPLPLSHWRRRARRGLGAPLATAREAQGLAVLRYAAHAASLFLAQPLIRQLVDLPREGEGLRRRSQGAFAEALTLATLKEQKDWLKDLERNPSPGARYVRSLILDAKPSAAIAIFALGKYQGPQPSSKVSC